MDNNKIVIPSGAQFIIEELAKHGHVAYVVGGCVRDSVLGRNPADWDITTDALPEEVKAIFPVTIDTGIEHGTVTVRIKHVSYEVTTYRIDGDYEDGRHPKDVTFTRSLEEDLKRRDFTINAMAYNDTDGLVDLFGGLEDLKAGVVRAVGNPTERFSEDALRMLRALRFSAQLGFEIEK
ncbi:MAG: polynucleotide adenylyltransferase, partial [Lachnospiraceae bacterium]|nr:polynucleotide adenylyltransferase [Lachnospiraceae bacterium]